MAHRGRARSESYPSRIRAVAPQACSAADVAAGVVRHVLVGSTNASCQRGLEQSQLPALAQVIRGVVCCASDGCNAPAAGPPPTTPAPVVTPFQLLLALLVPLPRGQFNATAQERFREQLAVAAGLGPGGAGRVNLTIGDAATAPPGSLPVNVSISMDNATAVRTVAAGLTAAAINKALANVGLPPVRFRENG